MAGLLFGGFDAVAGFFVVSQLANEAEDCRHV